MKAVVYHQYGPPDVLRLEEVPKPTPKDNEVLIRVHAASVNSWDWDLLRGKPFVNRMMFGLFKPKVKILGCDVAGEVEEVGRNVTRFQPGDEVFGDLCASGWGGFAEYVCARENALALKPAGMTFEEAAAVPQAGVLAVQSLRDKVEVQPGHRVLMNGAGGGVGTFVVQMAKSFGAEVTAVDRTDKLDLLRSVGADHVIDYTREDFADKGQQYDLMVDVVGNRSIFDYKRALKPKGVYAMVGGSGSLVFQLMFLRPLIPMITGRSMSIVMHKPNRDLEFIKELFAAGRVRPVIGKRYPLSEVPEAIRHLGEGHVQGKIVITI